ncbi:hypothetical protein BAY61_23230 [Prauserella marina]|uniref:Uncharacterized protein n=1 Tax=Prauserella marina TaxID=530584 RepID=A0A222VU73_9PSEU|nr:hypothetical protein [Prauserella marina]ASR37430.1 hypothetical protein BAY61_23230 [Prauserella marina]PWV74686.1 hypothetical protein DES30_10784 [Prauserella marina]SDD43326.1 hypothetical protein SAMN05421630_108167 [Prauserella marina]
MRADRYDFWFPLALLGFVLLGLAATVSTTTRDFGWFAYAPEGGALEPRAATGGGVARAELRAVSFDAGAPFAGTWIVIAGLVSIFLVVVAWYAARARREGTPLGSRRITVLVLAGSAEIGLGYVVLRELGEALDKSPFAAALALPLLLLAGCAGAGACFLRGVWRSVVLVIGGVLLAVLATAVLAPHTEDGPMLLVLASGLLTLAWLHRSVLLASLTVLFLLSGATANIAEPEHFVFPAGVLLAGAIAALVLRGGREAPPWTMGT